MDKLERLSKGERSIKGPVDMTTAHREGIKNFVGCWWCIVEGRELTQWLRDETVFIKHRIACKEHEHKYYAGEVA